MKILLQHARTQLYLQSLGTWTGNHFEALDFQESRRAIDFARDHALEGVQIVVQFNDRSHEEVFPLPTHAQKTTRHVGV